MVFTSDVGTLVFLPGEAERLRDYLLKGGVLWVDDFWGPQSWEQWTAEIGRVLDPHTYPIVDVPEDHAIFAYPYVNPSWQMTNLSRWRASGGTETSEQDQPNESIRAIFDERGGLMVLMTFNTDVFDAWEKEADNGFFDAFATQGFGMAVNVVLHVMSH